MDPTADGTQTPPLAIVRGRPFLTPPRDLYIPPDALEVFLDTFAGPLDLLLYLIQRQNLDILDIPIAAITDQYMEYVELMRERRLELAADYLVMAAILAEIKSRMLLPRPQEETEEGADPRADLVLRLQEYERCKQAAAALDALPRLKRDHFLAQVAVPPGFIQRRLPEVDLGELLSALRAVLARAERFASHRIEREPLSLRERMSQVLDRLSSGGFARLTDLFAPSEGRQGLVVTFLALLELIRSSVLEVVQSESFAPIHVKRREPSPSTST
ncbi:MAG: segregation and condensation protein A [Thermochromatium sp.]